MVKVQKILGILLGLCFLVSVTAGAAAACECNDFKKTYVHHEESYKWKKVSIHDCFEDDNAKCDEDDNAKCDEDDEDDNAKCDEDDKAKCDEDDKAKCEEDDKAKCEEDDNDEEDC